MSRNPVSRLLDLSEPPQYERARQGSKLDPFKGSVAAMLKEDAKAPATVIIEHLRRDGYDGGITILKEHLRQVRPLFSEPEVRQRTSYLPGEIGHTDWWDTKVWVPVGKGATREVFGLVTTLPHSAAHAAVFSFSKTLADFLPAFSGTLLRLGGVSEKMVVDRDSSIVVPRSRPARLHDEVAAVFGGFRVKRVILGARKPQSKGQVERTIGYLETSFLPLRRFEDLEDLQAQHDQWTVEVAFGRHHRRVGAKPAQTAQFSTGVDSRARKQVTGSIPVGPTLESPSQLRGCRAIRVCVRCGIWWFAARPSSMCACDGVC